MTELRTLPHAWCPACGGWDTYGGHYTERKCSRCGVSWRNDRASYNTQEPGVRYPHRMPPLWMTLNMEGGLCWCGAERKACGRKRHGRHDMLFCCTVHRHVWNRAKSWWSEFRMSMMVLDGRRCVQCGKKVGTVRKRNYPFWKSIPFVVDHIVPIRLGSWCYEEANIQTLCEQCNKAKTAGDAVDVAVRRKLELNPGQMTLDGGTTLVEHMRRPAGPGGPCAGGTPARAAPSECGQPRSRGRAREGDVRK